MRGNRGIGRGRELETKGTSRGWRGHQRHVRVLKRESELEDLIDREMEGRKRGAFVRVVG